MRFRLFVMIACSCFRIIDCSWSLERYMTSSSALITSSSRTEWMISSPLRLRDVGKLAPGRGWPDRWSVGFYRLSGDTSC